MRRLPTLLVLIALSVVVHPAAAGAQTVRGIVSRADANQPVEGAFVEVLDASGVRVVAGLTDSGGRYRLESGDGVTLVITYVGFSEFRAPLRPGTPDQVTFLDASLEAAPIALEGLSVVTEDRCGSALIDFDVIGRAWTEATRVLAAADWADEAGAFRYDVELFERRLDRRARRVESESRRVVPALGRHPFRSPNADELASAGYVDDDSGRRTYYAPDVDVLLSDSFLDTHCFGITRGDRDHPNQLGLTFRPIDGRDVPDIAGTFWIDLATSELRTVDFRYEGLDRDIETSPLGGSVTLDRVEGGGWIVSEWAIRTPAIGLQPIAGTTERREVLIGVQEHGGQLRRVRRFGQEVEVSSDLSRVRGRVVEEESLRPLSGARLRLAGTPFEARADDNGLFEFRDLRDGIYELEIEHQDVFQDGFETFSVPVSATAGPNPPSLPIGVPTRWSSALRSCAAIGTELEARRTVLTGKVVDEITGTALPRASVRVSWLNVNRIDETGFEGRRVSFETEADASGAFTLCNVPTQTELRLSATALGIEGATRLERLEIGEVRPTRLTVEIQTPATVFGEVRDASTGEPVPSVRVVVATVSALSDEDGRFEIQRVAPGRQPFEAGHIAYGLRQDSIDVSPSGITYVDVRLTPEAIELAPLEVSVTLGAAAEARRRGTRVDLLDEATLDVLTLGARDLGDVLTGAQIPGLYVQRTNFYLHPDRRLTTRVGLCVQLGRNAGAECRMPEVYVDGTRMSRPHFHLLDLLPRAIKQIEFLPSMEAGALYPKARYGVILITTK